jgi:MFS family permease
VLLPRSRDLDRRATRDVGGAVLLGTSTLLMLGTLAQLADPRPSWPWVAVGAVAALGAAASLWAVEERVQAPLVSPDRMRALGITRGLGGALLGYLTLFGPLVLYPQVFGEWHLPAGRAGLVLTCLPVGFALTALLGTRVGTAVGNVTRVRVGGTVAAVSAVLQCVLWDAPVVAAVLLLLSGAGLGLVLPANNALIMTAVPASASAVTGGLINVARALGTSFGVALTALGVRISQAHGWATPPLVMAGLAFACFLMAMTAEPKASAQHGNVNP